MGDVDEKAGIDNAEVRAGLLRRILQVVLVQLVMAALLFAGAGTWRWFQGWLYLVVTLLLLLANFLYVWPRNPTVVVERGKHHEGTKGFDKWFTLAYGVGVLAMPVLAGVDAVRFGITPLPGWTTWVGVLLLVLSNIPVMTAMAVNPFLERTARIQKERGQFVVDSGPYRVVRHPMYSGSLIQHLALPCLFGSGIAFALALVLSLLLVWRTAREDRMLHDELEGYADFAKRTRYRLVPYVW